MGEGHGGTDACTRPAQGLGQLTQDQVGRVGDVSGGGMQGAIEDEDLALRQQAPQVIVGAALAEAELEHRAGEAGHQRRRVPEAGPLGRQPVDHAVEGASPGRFSDRHPPPTR